MSVAEWTISFSERDNQAKFRQQFNQHDGQVFGRLL
jgi:hypothetical protein